MEVYPQIIHFNGCSCCKPSILGPAIFRKLGNPQMPTLGGKGHWFGVGFHGNQSIEAWNSRMALDQKLLFDLQGMVWQQRWHILWRQLYPIVDNCPASALIIGSLNHASDFCWDRWFSSQQLDPWLLLSWHIMDYLSIEVLCYMLYHVISCCIMLYHVIWPILCN